MSFDIALEGGGTAERDLTLGWKSGLEECRQRLLTRLARVKREWFLSTEAGVPWYSFDTGSGALLGGKDLRELELRLVEVALDTEGVVSVTECAASGSRAGTTVKMTVETEWGGMGLTSTRNGEWS